VADKTVSMSAEEFEQAMSQHLSTLAENYMRDELNTDLGTEKSLKALVAMGQQAQDVLNRDYRVSGFGQARTSKEVKGLGS
jgi:hypothetical protein